MTIENIKIIDRYPPQCRTCFYPDQDDKERILVKFINSKNGQKAYAIRCPNIIASNGTGCINFKWLANRKQALIKQRYPLRDYKDKKMKYSVILIVMVILATLLPQKNLKIYIITKINSFKILLMSINAQDLWLNCLWRNMGLKEELDVKQGC